MKSDIMKFETLAIRIQADQTSHREHSTPLYPTSSFTFESAEQMRAVFGDEESGFIYSRFINPNVRELEVKMAALEGYENAYATASGMAAVFATIMSFLENGDHLLATRALFGSSFQMITKRLIKWGIEYDLLDIDDLDDWESFVRPNTKMLFTESPSNPSLQILDLERAGSFCKSHNLIFVVDNCFATPYLQLPKNFGADIVVHSATKYIDGQGRVLGGVVCGSDELIHEVKAFCRNTGPALSPFNAWILSKSLETLSIRMDRHCQNAQMLTDHLADHHGVHRVLYPFSENHPQLDLSKKQMTQGGGIVIFNVKNGLQGGRDFIDKVKMISRTANLGDTRTIATHPASTTHAKLSETERVSLGITDDLIRISCGLEHIDDIIIDIDQALR